MAFIVKGDEEPTFSLFMTTQLFPLPVVSAFALSILLFPTNHGVTLRCSVVVHRLPSWILLFWYLLRFLSTPPVCVLVCSQASQPHPLPCCLSSSQESGSLAQILCWSGLVPVHPHSHQLLFWHCLCQSISLPKEERTF